MKTTLTSKNQITLPAALVERLALRPGAKLEWRLDEDSGDLRARVVQDPATLVARLRGVAGKAAPGEQDEGSRLADRRERDDRGKDDA